jgi:hypothetical protein
MRIVLAFLAMLAIQASTPAQTEIPLTPDQTMKLAVARSINDTNALKERYLFDTVRTPPAGESRCKNPADTQVDIPDLFGPNRYVYVLDDIIPLNERLMYVISFSPKPGKEQPKTPSGGSLCQDIKNQTLNQLRGIVYVDLEDLGVARVVTHVNNPPAKIKTGRLYQMDVTIEQFRLDGIWVPSDIQIEADKSYWFGWFSHSPEKITIRFENFRLKAP